MTELGTRSTYRKSGCRTLSAYGCARLSPTRPLVGRHFPHGDGPRLGVMTREL